MNDKQIAELMNKLDVIAKLLASNILEGKNLTQQALALSSLGIERKDIAWILGEDPDLISQTLYQTKQAKGRKKEEKK
jgi:hypothetical protein